MEQIEKALNKGLLVVLVFLGLVWVGSAHATEKKEPFACTENWQTRVVLITASEAKQRGFNI